MDRVDAARPENPALALLKRRLWLRQLLLALLLELVVEGLSRRAVFGGVSFLFQSPLCFLYNSLLIAATLSLAVLTPRRRFTVILVSCIWLGLGVANCVLLGYRTTPLAATDFSLIVSVWGIIGVYLKPWQCVLIVLALLALLAGLVVCFLKAKREKIQWRRGLLFFAFHVLLALSATFLLQQAAVLGTTFGNLPDAYRDYGFPYCFTTSVVDRGIDEPEDYSEEEVEELVDELDSAVEDEDGEAEREASGDTAASEQTPNILMVQLESFFDVNHVQTLEFSENPVPVFTELKESCASGYLTVPSIGAGTANTEFEVITGMSLDYFGTGEYPYKTILQSSTCETVNYNLKELGYRCHAIHNHTGTFYDRQDVFSHLGFDTFTSLEYMSNVSTNELGWAKDSVLTGQIQQALDSTQGQDFIYTISVQAHGKYPTDDPLTSRDISVTGLETASDVNRWEYYLEQLHDTDAFLGALINMLEDYDEPVVLVLFGDHLPSLDIEAEELDNGDLFQTEYVIWSNFGLEAEDQDLCAYQLTAHVLDLLDIHTGLLTKLHQTGSGEASYQEDLELLEYDMLYGNMDAYDGVNPYEPTDLQMGVLPITLSHVRAVGGSLFVSGENFTEASQVLQNGETVDTIYVDTHTLMVPGLTPEAGDSIRVAQVSDDGIILSETDALTFSG